MCQHPFRPALSWSWVLGLMLWLLLAGRSSAGEDWFLPGEMKSVDGRVSLTFWTDAKKTRYVTLPGGTRPEVLLAGVQIQNPPHGITVETVRLEAGLEQTSSNPGGGRRNKSWQHYVISGTWTVQVPKECPVGEYTVRVSFPAVPQVANQLGAAEPSSAPSIPLSIKVFASEKDRNKYSREYNAGGGVAILVLILALVAIAAGWWWWKRTFG
jgi:hypothetical protein